MERKCSHFLIDSEKSSSSVSKHISRTEGCGTQCANVNRSVLQSSFPVSISCQASDFNLSELIVEDSSSSTRIKDEQAAIRAKLEKERHRRHHCERQNHRLRSKLMEERKKLSAAIAVQGDMNFTVQQLQNSWDHFTCQWKSLEEYEDVLTRTKQNKGAYSHCDQHNNSAKIKSPRHEFCQTACNDSPIFCSSEKRIFEKKVFGDNEIRGFTNKKEEYMAQVKSQFNHKKNESEIRIKQLILEKQVFKDAQKKLQTMNDQYQAFKTELFVLKENRGAIILKLEEVNREINTLNQFRMSLLATVDEIVKKENCIQCEMRELSRCMDEIDVELKTYFAEQLEHVHNNVQDSKVIANKGCDMRDYVASVNRHSYKDLFDLQVLEECHNEEISLYQLRLEQAIQEIEKLEAQVSGNLKSGITEKVRHESETHWQKCNYDDDDNVDGDLATDGAECSVLQSASRQQNEHEVLDRRNMFHGEIFYQQCNTDDICENISTRDGERLEKKLTAVLMEECNLFKKEILSIIGQEMKQNISDEVYQSLSTLESTLEQKLSHVKGNEKRSSNYTDEQMLSTEETSEVSAPILYEEPNYLDYGSVLAYSYFYGYLKLILPVQEFGSPPNGIKEKIVAYINGQHLTVDSFPSMKLIILVPLSLDSQSDLQELSRDEGSAEGKFWIELAKHRLEDEVVARAGNTRRPYDVPVYKIKDPDKIEKPKYVAATVALKSLFDVVNMNPADSNEIRQQLQDTILSFCRTLEIIIRESEDCKDLCEIICFAHRDSSGKRVNIAKVILDRIDKLPAQKNKCYKMPHPHPSMRQHMV